MPGTVASDLALTQATPGSAYIGGGIVPRWGEFLARSPFCARLEDKGRYRHYLRGIPVYVTHAPQAALLGAAHAADMMTGAGDAR